MNQDKMILNHLKSGKSLTALEALRLFNCLRLAARIEEIKEQGYPVKTEIVSANGKRYAKYILKAADYRGGGRCSLPEVGMVKVANWKPTRTPSPPLISRPDLNTDLFPSQHWTDY